MAIVDWDLRKLQLNLDKKSPAAVYFLYGEEIFLLDEALRAIKMKVLKEGAQDFNFDSFLASDVSVSHVRDAVETLPVMCDRRLVIYKNVEHLKEDAWSELEPVLANTHDTATLVLVASKIDRRKKYIKQLQAKAVFVELKKPFDNQIPMWIDYIAHLNNAKLSKDAISVLQELVGSNLSEINNEIKKIQQYVGSTSKTIELQDVLQVVSRARIESVFNLTDAIGRRDRAHALVCLANLLEHGQNEVGVVALIHRQIRILAAIYEAQKSGLSGLRLSQKIGVPEFFMKQYLEQTRLWGKEKLTDAISALHETDKALKSSPVSSHIWLENFILKTC
ncbi:MAG: DNA polymerase III subunit delta [Bdellovibrionales bacterium RBG_16_40_8]|nr:MAG: DNA polymerase III subunit delta [Bdellovibrionales bacterium RBG_16_40_8]